MVEVKPAVYSWAVAGVENWRLGVLLTGAVWRRIRYFHG